MSTNTQNELRKNIIELFEIEKLPEAKQEETIARIGKIILQSVLMRVLPMLSEENLNAYDKLMDTKPKAEEVFDFFFAKVPNFLQIMGEESENFRKESAEVLSKI